MLSERLQRQLLQRQSLLLLRLIDLEVRRMRRDRHTLIYREVGHLLRSLPLRVRDRRDDDDGVGEEVKRVALLRWTSLIDSTRTASLEPASALCAHAHACLRIVSVWSVSPPLLCLPFLINATTPTGRRPRRRRRCCPHCRPWQLVAPSSPQHQHIYAFGRHPSSHHQGAA